MAKKTPAKKPRRRLKRSVRRSLAAVLMITAIAVAAIPVPENYADNGDAAAGSMAKAADVHDKDLADYGYKDTLYKTGKLIEKKDSDGNVVKDDEGNPVMIEEEVRDKSYDESTSTSTSGGKIDLDKYAGWDLDDLVNADIMYSLATTDVGGGVFDLCWQFMFYEVQEPESHAERGVICKYNNQYSTEQLELGMNPITGYYTVNEDRFEAYYDENYGFGADGNPIAGSITHEQAMKNMRPLDPTKPVEFDYNDFKNGMPEDEEAFLQTYCKTEYDNKVKEFQQYQTAKDNYDVDSGLEEPQEPAKLSKTPALVLSMEQKLKFYCDQDKNLEKYGSGYTLRRVNDSRLDKKSNAVYMAQGGTPIEAMGASNDKNGFLAIETSPYLMCAIGSQAFKGVSKVVNLVIPSMIGYIGDEAFADAALMESIQIDNVAKIGNRAFKGCVKLATVKIAQGTEVIGADCFSGTAISEITLPTSITTIGYGAFSKCTNLASLNLNNMKTPCTVKEYAFYNCTALASVAMDESAIVSIGDGAFAVEGGSLPMGIVLPKGMSDSKSIGNYMFAGRSSLEYVVFPQNYGRSANPETKIPDSIFHRCANLQYVEFPTDPQNDPQACGFVKYDSKKLFADVIYPDFYVKGPKTNTSGDPALPRTSTWDAITAVSETVPYLYVENGVNYYEVSDGFYLLCINDAGVLTSCTLKPGADLSTWGGKLEIPATVGNTKVTGIASGCFSDSELNENVKSLKIADESISSIADGVFQGGGGDNNKDWLKLSSVYIGNSVTSIGKDAFKKCSSLIDVTFSSPLGGHESFTIGADAFKTESSELTFHGDIVKGYAPFDWAMDPDNIIDIEKPDSQGIRVCYKSMAPDYLTVMYNPVTKMVTLLDYPKADQIDSILADAHQDDLERYHVSSYDDYRVEYLYGLYSNSNYDDYRKGFAELWASTPDEEKEELYYSDSYGPWVNPTFVTEWEKWVDGKPNDTTTSSGSSGSTTTDPTEPGGGTSGDTPGNSASVIETMTDWLFEPLTVYATEEDKMVLEPYYKHYEYDVVKNAAANDPYRPSTPEEDYLRYAVENVVVPEGVDSIDVYGYVNNLTSDGELYKGPESNSGNYRIYFSLGWDPDTRNMYTRSQGEDNNAKIVPGLFSGQYADFSGTSDYEKFKRGNDTIKTVTLNSVKYLPDYAFDSCEQLWNVTLGSECADIGTAPFRGCDALSSVVGNDYYEADNGIIYSKNEDGSFMIEECFASRGKPGIVGQASVSVSNDPKLAQVSAIRPGAFEDCDVITDVNFGNDATAGLTEIPNDCFKNCNELQRVVLPVTVDDVGSGAFTGANRLAELTFYGKEVKISGSAFDNAPEKAVTRVRTYEDSAVVRYVKEYGTEYKLQLDDNPLGAQWQVTFLGPDYKVIEDLKDIDGEDLDNPQYVENGSRAKQPQDPESTADWTFDKWVGMNNVNVDDRITEDTVFYAQGYSNNGMVNGQYVIEFYDSIDGTKIGPTQYVDPGKDAVAPAYPTHEGYTFDKWSDSTTNIQSNKAILALYKANAGTNTSGNSSNTSGNSTNTSGNSTNTSGNASNTSRDTTSNTSNTSNSSNTSSSSTSTSSTTSGSDAARSLHRVTVVNGSGSGSYAQGATVVIAANEPAAGMRFKEWTTESSGVTLNQMTATSTMFTMPENDVLVIANFEGGTAATADTAGGTANNTNTTGTGNNNGGGTNTNGGNTRVDITKPGISNKDLATANVNGSTDNFVIKITETSEATKAVADALTNKYNSLDNILYYAMDISLWDSTGAYKLTGDQLSGISVDITIPIPDTLVIYGGNNMAGAVVNGNQLENLNESFTTINGVPCIRFTASHFSPYTVYVDTGNLTEGMLDTTPKTGDPIHPKWFLSIGLACLSIILFMKKDRKTKVKAA